MDISENTPQKRTSVFPPLTTLRVFIFQVLSDYSSCRRAVESVLLIRLLKGESANAINTGAYCKARMRLPLKHIVHAVKTIGSRLHEKAHKVWRWNDLNVVLVDGTTVLMPDTPENQKKFPQQGCQKPGLGFPILRMVGLISLGTGAVIDYEVGAYQGKGSGEMSLLSRLISSLSAGDLLLADRYYCTYAVIALMIEKGVPVLFQQHAKKKTDFRKGKKLGAKDQLTEWSKPSRKPVWMNQKDYDVLPDTITVRECRVKGLVFVTTLLNSREYPKNELAALYKERWKIELDFRSIKTNMSMEMLRCKTPEMVKKEIAVFLLAYNLIRGNIAQAGILFNKNPRRMSFKTAAQMLTLIETGFINIGIKRITIIAKSLLQSIASVPIGVQVRESQPRAIKRRAKAYPLLMKRRQEYAI